jgi:tetraacyldisaccharide 4'-kinase
MRRVGALRPILWLLSLAYAGIVQARARLYKWGVFEERRLNAVVVSVGNLSVGGTGKTPMVIWLAERLVAQGKRVGILSRGYKGKEGESDEVALMRTRLADEIPIGVGADRYAEGLKLAQKGIEWFLLDDGFQHLGLARDVDIVLVDGTEPLGSECLLPAGRLRELPAALGRADIIVVTRTRQSAECEKEIRLHSQAPIFYAWTRLTGLCQLAANAKESSIDQPPAGPVYAFCGLGNPEAFSADLERWRFRVVGRAVFPDHYRYSLRDVARLEAEARRAGATALVTTEKDAMNLRGLKSPGLPIYFCRIDLEVLDGAGFLEAAQSIAARCKAQSA